MVSADDKANVICVLVSIAHQNLPAVVIRSGVHNGEILSI